MPFAAALSEHPVPAYAAAVAELAGALGMGDAVELAGSVTPDDLAARYRAADVFVCLSDHEGFCFPLLEAMHHGVPVVAFDAGAVADTARSAAVVLADKAPAVVATAVHRVVTDRTLRAAVVEAGRARLATFDLEKTKTRYVDTIAGVIAPPVSVRGAQMVDR